MKRTKVSKLIAVASAFAILATQVTASAKLALTADEIIDGTQIGGYNMLSGFSVDSKNWSHLKLEKNYGEYHEHAKWYMNLTGATN